MRFQKHVFISYAHLDNRPLDEELPGWVTYFHRRLEVRLGELLGREPSIWRDEKLRGDDAFADAIVSELEGVAVLVTVLSPRYLESEWCERELRAFCQAAERNLGMRLGNKYRVFKVIKTPVADPSRLPLLGEVTGYEFFRRETDGRVREFNPAYGRERKLEFIQQLDDLAQDMAGALGRLTEAAPVMSVEREPVYLAEVGSDLREAREQVGRELVHRGHPVLPVGALPADGPECRARILEELGHCALSVHLVGASPGFIPDGEDQGVVGLQYRLAREKGLPTVVWSPPGLDPGQARPDHADFLQGVRSDRDFLQVLVEELKDQVLHRLAKAPRLEPAAPPDSGVASVYLLFHQSDAEGVVPILESLHENGLEVLLPGFDGTPSEVGEVHRSHLAECRGVLIYQGLGPDAWMQKMWSDVRRAAGMGRSGPIPARAFYLAPPESTAKKLFRTHEADVIRSAAAFQPEDLHGFMAAVGGA